MPMLILFVFLTGALLGMRFRVLVLIPAVGAGLIGVLWVGVLQGPGSILLPGALAWVGVEFGYLCGTAARYRLLVRYPPDALLNAKEPSQAS
jgi:hypothetical protein